MSLKEKAINLKTDIPVVLLAMKHPKTPWYAKMLAFIVIAYALSPIDLIPDFIPVLGYLDDVLLLPSLVVLTVRLVPAEVMEICRRDAAGMWQNGKPKRWYYGLPIILIWLLLLWLIVKAVWL